MQTIGIVAMNHMYIEYGIIIAFFSDRIMFPVAGTFQYLIYMKQDPLFSIYYDKILPNYCLNLEIM